MVLVFTDGGDDPGPGKHVSYNTVLKRAQAEGYMVYAIGFHSKCRCGAEGRMIETDPDPSLKKIAAESGGGYFELKEGADLSSTFTRVAQELHSQYVIGFTPASLDGKLHALQVRVKRPGMTARARKSYIASPENSRHAASAIAPSHRRGSADAAGPGPRVDPFSAADHAAAGGVDARTVGGDAHR